MRKAVRAGPAMEALVVIIIIIIVLQLPPWAPFKGQGWKDDSILAVRS